ncbi:hypothetical protein BN59_02166 [Legionella massiliensis]|uniref:Cytochrome c domain-containing protein n=1 Tax=Legionella massiliensis TaxID=1034943 RepID=A0A078L1D8_9GAMM|nr:cytochrome c [Legionella massiliensis]CDZ77873.1 hypothetical protein BN59_02166 [Legionella massiliensis]CEE13611.1 hypothetical protein BN1094_02166 [Legionella massiliensis]
MKRLAILLLFFSSFSQAAETLTTTVADQETTYSREMLLAHPKLITIKQAHLPAYPGQLFDLKAVPLCSLLKIDDQNRGNILKIRAWDTYISYFKLHRIYPCDGKQTSIAYVAIEEPNKPWPILAKAKRSAGPFYLIWQGKKVPTSDWVFGIENVSTTKKNPFDSLLPSNSTTQEAAGLEQFATKCGVCHSINLIGNQDVGPDLNFPMNPTEYLAEPLLRQYIRNPQSVRHMKNDKMFAFTKEYLSDAELDNLLAFLKLMKRHKLKEIHRKT